MTSSRGPHLALWQACTVLREHRGDGHLAALLTAGLDGCEALVSFAAVSAAPEANFAGRGWTGQQWAEARERLAERGLVDAEGRATDRGRALRDDVERTTDRLAAERADRLAKLIHPGPAWWVAEAGVVTTGARGFSAARLGLHGLHC
ncbi:hypothetical protein [Microtetraspora sp. NBRC 13810]|uniref:SCO6745 family protein n=1 Tax=Microtetraspora sp. NBRC 13810 TaxID=3030990 RepID=UPI0025525717|nr:hypothetical protein [Microtetraspora sp. NBRC 13810]